MDGCHIWQLEIEHDDLRRRWWWYWLECRFFGWWKQSFWVSTGSCKRFSWKLPVQACAVGCFLCLPDNLIIV
jgi:hypothetical protein